MGSSEKWYLAAAVYSDTAMFTILTLGLIFLFFKLRFKVDGTGVITLAFFWLSVLVRMITSLQI